MLLLVDYWLVVGWNLSILWTFGDQDSSNWFICGAHGVQLTSLASRPESCQGLVLFIMLEILSWMSAIVMVTGPC